MTRAWTLLLLVPLAACAAVAPVADTLPSTTRVAPSTTAELPSTTAVAPAAGTFDESLATPDGRTRTYRLYVPAGLPAGPVALLVALHGGTGSGRQFERSSGFDRLAAARGFVVVYPDGVGGGPDETDLRTWNAGICCGAAARKQVDDVGFIRSLIDTIEARYDIDPARVFAAGHSNGGFMAYRLACELSDRIVAVGLQAGGLGIDSCTPARPVSVLHIHGADDTNVPIGGGVGSGISQVTFPPLADSLRRVGAAMGCDATAVTTVAGGVTTSDWTGCDGGVAVRLEVVDGETHTWMTAPGFDAATEIVDFLQ